MMASKLKEITEFKLSNYRDKEKKLFQNISTQIHTEEIIYKQIYRFHQQNFLNINEKLLMSSIFLT